MKYLWLLFFLAPFALKAQKYNKYWIELADKADTPYSIHQPQAFLSPRAIERRKKQGIAIEENDLPVSPNYILKIRDLGAKVDYTSRWFNACSVYADPETYERILKLPFVKSGEAVGRFVKPTPIRTKKAEELDKDYPRSEEYYGYGENQIKMLKGHLLHKLGYDGTGMLVAVLDGGFSNVDIMPFFDSLRADGRLLDGWDFVENDPYVFESSSHGSQVLSTMASNLPGLFVGTAPGASFICMKTEDTRSELRIEEDNWIAGAELADSIGADVLTSSLGYTRFNDKSMNYSYKDMDGNTARITRGADIATTKGILVVNSAGNEGSGDWKYIGAPADGINVLAVGAVNSIKRRAFFSSVGPSPDGRIKPNVSARGENTTVGSLYGYNLEGASGTSFSAPVTAGMVTSLWQAFPDKTNMEIKAALEESGSLNSNPDYFLGYGIPDVYRAYIMLSEKAFSLGDQKAVSNKRYKDKIQFSLYTEYRQKLSLTVKNILGQTVYQQKGISNPQSFFELEDIDLKDWPSGVYFIEYTNYEDYFYDKFVIE